MVEEPTSSPRQTGIWKSWRLYVLLGALIIVSGTTLVMTNDTAQFVLKLHFGSEKMKTDCKNRLYEFKESLPREDGSDSSLPATLPPEWTWRYLISDSEPLTRIMTARILWNLHPAEGKYLSVLMAETDNSDPLVRSAAIAEFWNMDSSFESTCPILRKHLFEDQDGSVRLGAFDSLLTLSRNHPAARNIIVEAVRNLPYETTRKSIRNRVVAWNKRTDIGTTNRIDIDAANNLPGGE